MADTTIRPFTLETPQADIDDLKARLDRARWPDELPGDEDDGIKQSYVRLLYDQWRNDYDWRATEARSAPGTEPGRAAFGPRNEPGVARER